jgi:hypothetical protein
MNYKNLDFWIKWIGVVAGVAQIVEVLHMFLG